MQLSILWRYSYHTRRIESFIIVSIDCPIEGQEYQLQASCPKTCDNPHLLCTTEDLPGCGCPNNQVIDETNNRCVHIDNCPS